MHVITKDNGQPWSTEFQAIFTLYWIDNRGALKTIPDRPPCSQLTPLVRHNFCTIMSWNAPIPKVICSISDRFLEHSTSNVNGAVQSISPAFGMESHYHSLGLEVFAKPKQISIRYGVNSPTPDWSGLICWSIIYIIYIVLDRFPPRAKNQSGIV